MTMDCHRHCILARAELKRFASPHVAVAALKP